MSDEKKAGPGIFINRKAGASSDGGSISVPKNVPKRWLYVAGAVMGFSVFAATFFRSPPTPMAPQKKAESMIDVTPKGAEEKSWQAKSQADIAALKDAVTKLADENKNLNQKLAEQGKTGTKQSANLPDGVVPPPMGPGQTNLSALGAPPTPPAPPQLPPSLRAPVEAQGASSAPRTAAPAIPESPSTSREPMVFKPEASKSVKDPQGDAVKAKVAYKTNPYSGMLPAGAFAPVALLNGLDAGTASANQANPQPVLMNVQDQATLPGSAKYRLKSCFVLASAYGDLSAERVYFRLAQLSCIDKQDRLVMTTPVQGYVVDSDGKLGMRGTVADRQGAKLGKALLAGFAQGLGSAFGSAQSTMTNSALGAVTSITGGDALKQSGLQGASTAASQLAQFYLKEAQNIFPVISIDAGRTGSMVFTQSIALAWGQGDTQYTKEVKPD
jgi:conjugal transfer pilus assembly protein TraB